MNQTNVLAALTVLIMVSTAPLPAAGQSRSGRQRRSQAVQRAIPRPIAPRSVRPQIARVVPYRYRYRAPYGVRTYGYPGRYGYLGGYGYPGSYLSLGLGLAYPTYGYGAGYRGYGYPPPGYLAVVPGRAYGGVRIDIDQRDAEVLVDGYFVGVVDDFDGVLQQVSLEPGPHRIEIRAVGYEPIQFEVNVAPGQTVTYRSPMQALP